MPSEDSKGTSYGKTDHLSQQINIIDTFLHHPNTVKEQEMAWFINMVYFGCV